MTKVAILGAGQIGSAVAKILNYLSYPTTNGGKFNIDYLVIDSNLESLKEVWANTHPMNLSDSSVEELATVLKQKSVTHVINALPFFLNERVASAAASAKCHYIDFTEDDVMADKVQKIFSNTGLNCAVKCGLAPGFINYIGYDLITKIAIPESLTVSVGALPRNVSFEESHPENSYNLSWSVDGLVNEYIRPCSIRRHGKEQMIEPLGGLTKVILDGTEYEAAYTSGGIGSLVRDLKNVPNVRYMTLRYPGHYKYVQSIIDFAHGDFEIIKKEFLKQFPFSKDDVIVVYADAIGTDKKGTKVRCSYSNKFYGTDGLTGIQATTASSGVAILEMMLDEKISGNINHTDIFLPDFEATESFKRYYKIKD